MMICVTPRENFSCLLKWFPEIQSLTDNVRSLNRDHKELIEFKSNNKRHYDATVKLNVVTWVQNHRCNVTKLELIQKRKDLIELANQGEIRRLREEIRANKTDIKITTCLRV